MLTIRTDIDTKRAHERLKEGMVNFPMGVRRGVQSGIMVLVRHAVKTKFENKNPPYLDRQTGTAIRNVTASPNAEPVTMTATRVAASWGSHLDYIRKHEEGGTYTENVPAHTRRAHTRVAHTRRAHVRHTRHGEVSVRAHDVQAHTVRAHEVSAHTRHAVYIARRMFAHTIKERKPAVELRLRKAVKYVLATGKVPKPSDLERGAVGLFGGGHA